MTVNVGRAAPSRAAPSRHGRPRGSRRARADIKYSPYLYVAPFFVLFASSGCSRWSTPRGCRCTTGT